MPIRQPVQTTIRADDFHNKAFSFPVESIVKSNLRPENLVINVSEGYLLTSSLVVEPKQEQVVPYAKSPTGEWVAKGVVTVVAAENYPTGGKIIIQNSLAETLVLTIDNPLALLKQPELVINYSTGIITQPSAETPGFIVLTIAQHQADTPVTLTTDSPTYFQFASDSRPAFKPSLTLIPSAAGTYVHVRYFSSKRGPQTAQLTIETPYDSQTITLEGRRAGLLPALRTSRAIAAPLDVYPDSASLKRKQWIMGLTVSFMAGLALVSYHYRCQLFPGLCTNRVQNQVVIQNDSVYSEQAEAGNTLEKIKSAKQKKITGKAASTGQSKNDLVADTLPEQRLTERTRTSSKASSKPSVANRTSPRPRRRSDSVPSDKESELEKVLNRPD